MDLPDQEIIQAIKDIITTSNMKSRDVIASISAFSTFATVIQMPYMSEEDLAKTIPFEARKYIPIPLDQVVLDWSIVGVAGKDGAPAVPTTPVPPVTRPVALPQPTPRWKCFWRRYPKMKPPATSAS